MIGKFFFTFNNCKKRGKFCWYEGVNHSFNEMKKAKKLSLSDGILMKVFLKVSFFDNKRPHGYEIPVHKKIIALNNTI